jgi:hypothetical protein
VWPHVEARASGFLLRRFPATHAEVWAHGRWKLVPQLTHVLCCGVEGVVHLCLVTLVGEWNREETYDGNEDHRGDGEPRYETDDVRRNKNL